MRVELLNASLNTITGNKIATYLLSDFPKVLLAERNTHHGTQSSNAESSRARPNKSVIEQLTADPYLPRFTINEPGMAGRFVEDPIVLSRARKIWQETIDYTMLQSQRLAELGIHKQDANRLLDPYLRVSVITTATDLGWRNFFKLRDHEMAQPAFQEYAAEMHRLWRECTFTAMSPGEWHKPWPDESIAVNTAKAAGISYANHNRDLPEEKRQKVHDDLISADPMHGSPLEHCALCIDPGQRITIGAEDFYVFDHFNPRQTLTNAGTDLDYVLTAKFGGFLQYRKIVEKGGTESTIALHPSV